jgi:hypothetical protein
MTAVQTQGGSAGGWVLTHIAHAMPQPVSTLLKGQAELLLEKHDVCYLLRRKSSKLRVQAHQVQPSIHYALFVAFPSMISCCFVPLTLLPAPAACEGCLRVRTAQLLLPRGGTSPQLLLLLPCRHS